MLVCKIVPSWTYRFIIVERTSADIVWRLGRIILPMFVCYIVLLYTYPFIMVERTSGLAFFFVLLCTYCFIMLERTSTDFCLTFGSCCYALNLV